MIRCAATPGSSGSGSSCAVREFSVSRWFILMAVIQPVIFASIAFYLFQAGGRAGTLLYAALGAGMMGIWSSTLFGSGGALQWNRWQGTLELLVGAPPPFIVVLLPLTLATSSTGAYALVATLALGAALLRRSAPLRGPARLRGRGAGRRSSRSG